MFGVSFSELFVIAVVCLFLLDIRDLTSIIASVRCFIRKLFQIKDEVQETFAGLGKEIKSNVEYVVDSDKKLYAAVDFRKRRAKIRKRKKVKNRVFKE
jgi:Sec-independent protein translocase protein TatA